MQPYGSSWKDTLALMHKRHALFTEIVKDYSSFDDFMLDWDEKMALLASKPHKVRMELRYTYCLIILNMNIMA